MNRSTLESIVPSQHRGRKAKVQISTNCYSVEAASKLYEVLKISLANVNNWGEFNRGISFYPGLVNKNRQVMRRIAQSDDLIKILFARWQALSDWRKITRVEERMSGNTEVFFITIAPAMNPELEVPDDSPFLKPESTVTFFVVREENKLQLEVHTRNERLNCQLSGIKAKLQSAMMGVFIAAGFYEIQWTRLIKSVLKYSVMQMKISGSPQSDNVPAIANLLF